MSLFDEVSNLMLESATLYRYVSTSGRGEDVFSTTTERVSPARLIRKEQVIYDEGGRPEARTRGEIVMPVPLTGTVKKQDKLIMDEGEIFRVFRVRQDRDSGGNPYLAVTLT